MRLVGNPLFEHLHQAGLANPRLTTEHDYLPQAISHMPPTFVKQGHFSVAPHKGRQTVYRRYLKPMLHTTFLEHLIHLDRRSNAFDCMCPEVCDGEISPHELVRRSTHHDRVGRGEILEPGRDIGGGPQGKPFLPPPATHVSHDDQAGVDGDADGQAHPFPLSDPMASSIPSPARTARCASSSWATGQPK
jgi:hypothetical protein